MYMDVCICICICICIGGWGGESNWEIVSFRSCVRTRGLVVEWNLASNVTARLSLFPFRRGSLSLFPSESTVLSNEFQWVSSDTKWNKVKSSEIKWNQVKSSDIKWNQVSASETRWIQERPPSPTKLLSNFSWPYRYIYIYIYQRGGIVDPSPTKQPNHRVGGMDARFLL